MFKVIQTRFRETWFFDIMKSDQNVSDSQRFPSEPEFLVCTIRKNIKNYGDRCRVYFVSWTWAWDIMDQRGVRNTDWRNPPWANLAPPCHLEESASHHMFTSMCSPRVVLRAQAMDRDVPWSEFSSHRFVLTCKFSCNSVRQRRSTRALKIDLYVMCSGRLAGPGILHRYIQLAVNRQPGYRQGNS